MNRLKRYLARRWLNHISLEELEIYVKDQQLRRSFSDANEQLVQAMLAAFPCDASNIEEQQR
jgi:hypothetical protein